MTDRISVLSVALDQPYRDDDVQAIVDAIKMIKGVDDVVPIVLDPSHWIAEVRAKKEIYQKIMDAIG